MEKKPRRRKTPWALIVVFVVLALAAGYYLGMQRPKRSPIPSAAVPQEAAKPRADTAEPSVPLLRERIPGGKEGFKTGSDQDPCKKLQEDLKDFFEYLNLQPYAQEIEPGINTREWFNRILAKLSAAPPVPAGEGLDHAAMTNHIFYFFRHLEPRERKLLKSILVNEASTLEANMDLFFRWFFQGAGCPESVATRPAAGVLYSYAGFFLNTIGGRAYLSRSSRGVRDLVTYYCILILNDADKKGRNSYGIDIAPQVRALSREMADHKDFLFQKEYIQRLQEIQAFYAGR